MDQSNPKNYLDREKQYFDDISAYFSESEGTYSERMHAITRFLPRQSLSYLLARHEVFRQILSLHGTVLDFGVHRGGSFFTWLQLSAIYEPYNHIRRIVGFDSFEGFSSLSAEDIAQGDQDLAIKKVGGMQYTGGAAELALGLELYDLNQPLGHVPRGRGIAGPLPDTLQNYMTEHAEVVVALANFGLGLYEPTVEILKAIKPRLQKGSILLFEDLNQVTWPGETRALFEVFEPHEIQLQRVPYCPHLSWMQVGV